MSIWTTAALGLLILVPDLAGAEESFGARVQRAKLVEESSDGKEYQQRLWKQAGDETTETMHRCFPKGREPDTDRFTLIADVLPNCTLAHVEVRPATAMATCFAKGFRQISFPRPPESTGSNGIPLVVEMKITQ